MHTDKHTLNTEFDTVDSRRWEQIKIILTTDEH